MDLTSRTVEIDQCNCFAVRKAARRISRLYDAFLQPIGLRITQFLILATLAKAEQASVNALAERLDLERTAMGKTLAPLLRDGLIRIDPALDDRRSRIASLTLAGLDRYERALPCWRAAQSELAELNGQDRIDALRSELTSLTVQTGG
ncbi:transcriptional regulator [Sphingobium yanoikuyae]|jgi:DNA-binding MarR family transcriptional regulator|uniref:Transcriptional regulator n=1 Tax=Sphingobium yanoikuyae TaxID=13690 RepID=A0A177JWH1_SPHYA|nr:MarR family transcriptional regulator [Sphingobium yanoikuyae]OAH45388.1 transcriptional regulator [Sphingobium yanoikuyae]